jgi:hypothetical protein
MKKIVFGIMSSMFIFLACNSSKSNLQEVKTPFKGNSYESNRRYFRAVSSGESINLETARNKALLSAKQRIASSVQTEIKNVTENYTNERTSGEQLGDFGERFQQLTREVLSTNLVGSVQFDEKIYQKQNKDYLVWVAVEARKKDIYKNLKKIALERNTLSEKEKKAIAEMIDKSIADLQDND